MLAATVSVGCGIGGAAATTATRTAAPCAGQVRAATWSPSGRRIAYVVVGNSGSRAICVATPNGGHAQPLRFASCRGPCRLDLIDSPSELAWARPKLLLYLDLYRIFDVPLEARPEPLGPTKGTFDTFSLDAKADRIALGTTVCEGCRGPITVLDVPSGRVAGAIGGPKTDAFWPSLSPDGKRVVFVEAIPAYRVWIASSDGSNQRRLAECGGQPLWSPAGNEIACLGEGSDSSALMLVSPRGGRARTLVPNAVPNGQLLGWSPDGKQIAFLRGRRSWSLDVVDVKTGRMRRLLAVGDSTASAAWSPDSRQLLVTLRCGLWRIPVDGPKPRRLRDDCF